MYYTFSYDVFDFDNIIMTISILKYDTFITVVIDCYTLSETYELLSHSSSVSFTKLCKN